MKHETYQILKQAYMGHVDKHALVQLSLQEKDPFVQRALHLLTNQTQPKLIPWNTQIFTTEFRKGIPQERLEETFFTFFLRLVAIIKEEMHVRTFQNPETHAAVHAWVNMWKFSLYAVSSLLYNVTWEESHFFELDKTIFELLHEGKSSALRQFLVHHLKIQMTTTITLAEQMSETLNFLTIGQFGSSFWRLLHWVAEAMDMRDSDQMTKAKQIWRELLTGPLYRILRCGICMGHMRSFTQELKNELMDVGTNYRQLWYNIHNKVTNTKKEYYGSMGINLSVDSYSESELDQDVAFMRQALVP